MDPIAAISLAGTVVQFLDFGIRLVSKASEICNAADGLEVRHTELGSLAENFTSLCRRIRSRQRRAYAYSIQLSEDERMLRELTEQCAMIGDEITAALEKAKLTGPHKVWKSVRQALKSILGRDRIQDLYDRLKQYREQIVVVLLVINNSKQTNLAGKVQTLQQNVLDSEARIIDESRKGWAQVLSAIQSSKYNANNPGDVSLVADLLSDMANHATDQKKNDMFLSSLYYPRMQDRREWISTAHARTFNWALEGDSTTPARWHSLKDWLIREDGIYWLTGKAGSGKSTLMKYIDYDERTASYLKEWASPLPLVRSSFYFWNAGTTMQKSQIGLLQCLLYEMLKSKRALIQKAFPARWQASFLIERPSFSWTASELFDALNLLAETEFKTKFCFIIDGLDEFDGDHQGLINVLSKISRTSNIKILASSRPWLVFQDAFTNNPRLTLQDLTHSDIQAFAEGTLRDHPRFHKMLSLEPERGPKLISQIVSRASGVFLWVFLVVSSLSDGLTNADRMSDLQRRLEELPTDLEAFFMHILTKLDPFYSHQASQFFRLALEAQKPLPVLTFSYLDEDDPDFAIKRPIQSLSQEEEEARCETVERRLNSRCKGLLESRRRQACDEYSTIEGIVAEKFSYEVDFLHRTVRDFLKTPTVHVRLVAPDTDSFNANMTLAKAFVAQLKGLRCSSHVQTNFEALWSHVFDILHYISRVEGVPATSQEALLDELDRTAGNFRDVAIGEKRLCSTTAHWVNTGYRFALEPEWDNDLLSLCVQFGIQPYVRQKLLSGDLRTRGRKGRRPLLAFAMTERPTLSPAFGVAAEEAKKYFWPYQPPMVKLLLEMGEDPNGPFGGGTIWEHCIASIKWQAKFGVERVGSPSTFQVKNWFDIMKSMILHGAGSNTSGGTEDSNPSILISAKSIFKNQASCDVLELEEVWDHYQRQKEQQEESLQVKPSEDGSRYLQLPTPEKGRRRADSTRSTSGQSAKSDASAASWRLPQDDDIVVPMQTFEIHVEDSAPQKSGREAPPPSYQSSKQAPYVTRAAFEPYTPYQGAYVVGNKIGNPTGSDEGYTSAPTVPLLDPRKQQHQMLQERDRKIVQQQQQQQQLGQKITPDGNEKQHRRFGSWFHRKRGERDRSPYTGT